MAVDRRHSKLTMSVQYFLLVLIAVGQVTSLNDNPQSLSRNPLESNVIQKVLQEKPELSQVDSSLLKENNKRSDERAISNIVLGLLVRELIKSSNFPTLVATNISEKCHNDSQAYYDANLLLVNWANQMLESTGKFPEGLFSSGNVHANGLFDECISVQADWTSTSFQGKYCTVFIDTAVVLPWELADGTTQPGKNQRSNWVTIYETLMWLYNGPALKEPKVRDTDINSKNLPSVDFCIPSSCSMEDFRSSVAQLIGSRAIGNITYEGNFYYTSMVAVTDENYCYTKEKIDATPQFDGADITVIFTLSLLGLIILLATAHECWLLYNDRPLQSNKAGLALKALHCFSMLTNSRKLLSTKSLAVDNLACLNGIRVLSTTWIVLYHTYYLAITNTTFNTFSMIEDAMTWQVHGVLNATIAVDTFFLMSALLVTFSLMRELDRNKGRFNVGLFYLHRYLRLTPVYAFILGFIATLLIYLGAGPYWQTIRDNSEACRWNWWNHFLYINNYVMTFPYSDCMGETWYLACEMQMFLLSPLFIYPLWKWWKMGLAWASFNIVALISGTIAIFVVWDLPAMGFFTRGTDNPYYFYGYYVQMWTRFPPYILGILLGWLLHLTKKKEVKMNKYVVAAGWVVAIVMGLAIVYGMVPYLDPEEVPEIKDGIRVSYGSFHRIIWTACVAWVIFACIHGYGGFVDRFLSWKVFIPLARLTYVVYLIHFTYLIVYHAFARKPYYYTKFYHTEHYFGTIVMVFFMAFIICLTIEVPFLNLEKLLLPSRTKKPVNVDQESKTTARLEMLDREE